MFVCCGVLCVCVCVVDLFCMIVAVYFLFCFVRFFFWGGGCSLFCVFSSFVFFCLGFLGFFVRPFVYFT